MGGFMQKEMTIVIGVKDDCNCLEQCIKSVLKQEGILLQILLADAGSTDGSIEILHQIAETDKRCEVYEINAKNEADVRNQMLPHVQNPYVWFINATAPIPVGSCEYLLSQAIQYDADIVAFATSIKNWGPGDWIRFRPNNPVLTLENKLKWFGRVHACFSPPTARVYRVSFLFNHEEVKFVTDNDFEGFLHNWYSTILADIIVVLPEYRYHQEQSSKLSPWKISGWLHHADIISAVRRVEQFLKSAPERAKYIEPFYRVTEYSINLHLREFKKCLTKLRNEILNNEIF
jgi:glycosyltransferase involved in cell wall biosynthesis